MGMWEFRVRLIVKLRKSISSYAKTTTEELGSYVIISDPINYGGQCAYGAYAKHCNCYEDL